MLCVVLELKCACSYFLLWCCYLRIVDGGSLDFAQKEREVFYMLQASVMRYIIYCDEPASFLCCLHTKLMSCRMNCEKYSWLLCRNF